MKYLLIAMILLSFNGCQDKENDAKVQAKHDAKIAAQARAEVLAEFEAHKIARAKEIQTQQARINEKASKPIIDTNQTKQFLRDLSQTVSHEIDIAKEYINIEINQTKNLLEVWNQKIENFVKEFDTVTTPTEINTSKGH
ncbi:MAG: hypothetical protein Q9M36_11955 [Sulfurovum sp.]|nr:hypothetical protein [Sulfurovum sp.]